MYIIYECTKCKAHHHGYRPKRQQKCTFCKSPLVEYDSWAVDGAYICGQKETYTSGGRYKVSKVWESSSKRLNQAVKDNGGYLPNSVFAVVEKKRKKKEPRMQLNNAV